MNLNILHDKNLDYVFAYLMDVITQKEHFAPDFYDCHTKFVGSNTIFIGYNEGSLYAAILANLSLEIRARAVPAPVEPHVSIPVKA